MSWVPITGLVVSVGLGAYLIGRAQGRVHGWGQRARFEQELRARHMRQDAFRAHVSQPRSLP